MTLVKICGITNLDDAMVAVDAGADAIGFNFFPGSPRYIQPDKARAIRIELPDVIMKVGVFADAQAEQVREIGQWVELDFLQFHGDETPYYCEQFATPYWKAFRLHEKRTLELMKKYRPSAYLVDAYHEKLLGGTGQLADWKLAVKAKAFGKIVLAGGLNPDNVAEAILAVDPWAVDTCSAIERRPGFKDHDVMSKFVEKVKRVVSSEE